nr:hypothetical protein [Tanacetum cinerariifolium]
MESNAIVEEDEDNWMTPIIRCLEEGIWPEDENEARTLRLKIGQYVMEEGIMFKKSYLSLMLECVGPLQANYIIREVHEGACGMHAEIRLVVAKIMTQGYYWPSMHRDTKEALDLLRPLPEGPRRLMFIIMAIDYFTKLMEAKPLAKTTRDFVYRRNEASRVENKGKLGQNLEGPYGVIEAYDNGLYNLCTMNDREDPNVPNEDVPEEDPYHLLDYDKEDPEMDIEEEEPEEDPVEEPEQLAGHGDQFDAHPNPQPGNMNGWVDDNDYVEEEDDENEDVDIEEDDDAEIIFPYEMQGDQTSPPRDETFDSEFEAEEADDELEVEEAGVEPEVEEAGVEPEVEEAGDEPEAKGDDVELKAEEPDGAPKATIGTGSQRPFAVRDFPMGFYEAGESSTAPDPQFAGGLAPWALRRDLEALRRHERLRKAESETSRTEVRMREIIRDKFATSMNEFMANMNSGAGGSGGASGSGGAGGSGGTGGNANGTGVRGARPTVPELTSECKEKDRVKFAMATLRRRALTWWNGRTKAMGIEAANNTPWSEPATINDAVHLAYQLAGQLIQDKADEATEDEKRKGESDRGGRGDNRRKHNRRQNQRRGLSSIIMSLIVGLKCEHGVVNWHLFFQQLQPSGIPATALAVLKPERLKADKARSE